MKAGGTFNTRVHQNDLNEIQSGQIYTSTLLRLPLIPGFRSGMNAGEVGASATPYGGRPDRRTTNAENPIVGNVAEGAQILPTRIQLPQPCNSIQLVWHAINENGSYDCSYPINSDNNVINGDWPLTSPDAAGGSVSHWAFGWLRLNGQGVWFPMSLLPAVDWRTASSVAAGSYMAAFPFGGFASVTAPMSFVDWVGYWDGAGSIDRGPDGASAHLLAIASANLSLSSPRGAVGGVNNYATPSGSGPEGVAPSTDSARSQDVLVRGNNGR